MKNKNLTSLISKRQILAILQLFLQTFILQIKL